MERSKKPIRTVLCSHSFTQLSKVVSKDKRIIITGALSPMEDAKQITKYMEEPLYGIIRVNFKEEDGNRERIFQKWEPGWTGYDAIIIILQNLYVFMAGPMPICYKQFNSGITYFTVDKSAIQHYFDYIPSKLQLHKMMTEARAVIQEMMQQLKDAKDNSEM